MNAPDTGADVGHTVDAAEGHHAPGQARLRQLADEQAALRRVATLVARGAPADELFAAVPQEAGRLLQADQMTMIRYGSDGTSTVVAGWRRTGEPVPPVGDRQRLGGKNLTTIIWRTRRPARIDSYARATGPLRSTTDEATPPGTRPPSRIAEGLGCRALLGESAKRTQECSGDKDRGDEIVFQRASTASFASPAKMTEAAVLAAHCLS
jgi:hypothetical protein